MLVEILFCGFLNFAPPDTTLKDDLQGLKQAVEKGHQEILINEAQLLIGEVIRTLKAKEGMTYPVKINVDTYSKESVQLVSNRLNDCGFIVFETVELKSVNEHHRILLLLGSRPTEGQTADQGKLKN